MTSESACDICGRPDGAGHEPRCYESEETGATMIMKKLLKPVDGHGWTIVFDEPITAAIVKAAGFKLSKKAIVIDGTIEFFDGDELTGFITKLANHHPQPQSQGDGQ